MAVLVLADVDQGKLTPATARVVAAAAELGPVTSWSIPPLLRKHARSRACTRCCRRRCRRRPRRWRRCWRSSPSPITHIVAAANATGRDVIPRLAALLDIMPVTDVTAIIGPNRFERPIYAGNATETVSDGQAKHLLTVRASAFAPPGPEMRRRSRRSTCT